MTTALLTTKLYIPSIRPELVPRPRLLERLDAGLHRKLTLVAAPAGFGKTVLVSEWAQRTDGDRAVAWLSLDEADNDRVRFLTYLIAALQTIDPEIGRASLSLLGSPQLAPDDALVTPLINDIASRPRPIALVLDDYHAIQTESVHKTVEFLITHQPPQMHVVVATREDPPLPVPRLRARGQVTEIRSDDLRFTPEEAATFLHRALGLTLDAEVVTALEARTEGWIAGLQLAAVSMQGKPSEDVADFVAAFGGSHRHVIDYLADEVLARQPGEIREFLRHTAVLDRLTAPLCDALTGRADAAALLKRLEEANLFLTPLDEQRAWYRYHQLLADFLRTELDEETSAALHLKAARWLAAHDLLPEAVKHALASGDMEEAARLIALAADGAFRSASFATLLGWLNALPEEQVWENAELATFKGLLLLLNDWRADVSAYAVAAERSLPPDAPPSSRGRVLSLKAQLALCDATLDHAAQLSKEALACLDAGDAFFRSLTFNALGQALEMQGDVVAAVDVYRNGAVTESEAGNQLGALVALTNLVLALNELGQRHQALGVCREVAKEGADHPHRKFPVTEGIYLVWSLLSYEANELDLARKQVIRALEPCERINIVDGILWGRYILTAVQLASGEIDAALQGIQDTRQNVSPLKQGAPQNAWLAALEAQMRLQQGDLVAAARWAEAGGYAPDDTPPHWLEPAYFIYVRLLLAQNRMKDAQTLLARLEHAAGGSKRHRKLITIYLQQALVEHALGHTRQSLDRVESAVHLAAPEGYVRAFLNEGAKVAELLPGVRHVAPTFVDGLLEAFSSAGQWAESKESHPSSAIHRPPQETLVEPLSERELEILQLIAAGRSNPEIGEVLYLSHNTVKWHVKNIYAKLNVHNRVEAVERAHHLRLL